MPLCSGQSRPSPAGGPDRKFRQLGQICFVPSASHQLDVSSLDLGSERACPRFFVTGLPLGMHVVTCQKQDEVLRLCQARLPRVLRQADFIVTFAEPAQIDVADAAVRSGLRRPGQPQDRSTACTSMPASAHSTDMGRAAVKHFVSEAAC
jgi:hypothetical protein